MAGLGEAACSKPSESSAAPTTSSATSVTSGAARRVAIEAGPEGYSPASINAKVGEPLVLVFTRTTKGDCLAEVVIPELNIKKELPLNTPVEVPVTFSKPGKVGFECGMAMMKGTINVRGT